MKISGIKATILGEANSNQPDSCLLELTTNAGLTGLALAHPQARDVILAMARDVLTDADPRGVLTHWQKAGKWQTLNDSAVSIHARAVLDIALWDLKAKVRNEPLWKILGAGRPRVNAYASWTDHAPAEKPFDDWTEQISGQMGMRAGKLVVGSDFEANQRNLARLRQALSANTFEPQLMIDAGGQWLPKAAIRHIQSLETEFDLTWVAGISERGDYLGAKSVSNSIRAAVCVGKDLGRRSAYLPFLQNYAADVIEIDLHDFGITGALQMADAAFGVELPITLSAYPGNVQVHLAAALPYCMSVEAAVGLPVDETISSDVSFESGWGVAGDQPGHGLCLSHGLSEPVKKERVD